MFSFWGIANKSPFKGPFTKAQCDGQTPSSSSPVPGREIQAASAAAQEDSCEFGSNKYFLLCGIGGILSCGTTHTFVVPLDLVKCRLQVDAAKYKNLFHGFKVTVNEEGTRGLAKGWAPTFFGYSAQLINIWQTIQLLIRPKKIPDPECFLLDINYSLKIICLSLASESNLLLLYDLIQGLCKFGFYEIFKVYYANLLGEENAYLYRTSLYLASSASAEFFADIALAPFEAAKVKIQTMPGYANTFRQAVPKMMKEEGISAFYKGLVPLWCRQIPYTMMKFACFERTVELLYKFVVPKPRAECSKGEQLVVTFAAGYIAGVFCAVVSHPADVVVSKLNQAKGSSAFEVARSLGFFGMWNGLVPRIIMIGTLTALQWFIYDGVKVALRLPRPPPPEMPESLKQKLGKTE